MNAPRPRVREAIVVEGRYDKNALAQVVDAVILETDGFGIFSGAAQLALLRRMAEARGLVILTDSDSAGFLIRNYLKGCLPPDRVRHAYVPDIQGREKRKSSPSKEGKLGVEGMRPEALLEALRRAGVTFEEGDGSATREARITKTDLYRAGLSGRTDAAQRRQTLLKALDLPERLTGNALPEVLSALMERGEFLSLVERLFLEQDTHNGGDEE